MAEDEGRQTTGEKLPEAAPAGPSPGPPSTPPSGGGSGGGGSQQPVVSGPGIRIGRPFGVPIYVSPSWFVIAGFITILLRPPTGDPRDPANAIGNALGNWRFAVSFAYAVFLYASVVVHELAHSAVAKRLGLPVRRIVIHFLGGVSEIEKDADSPGKEFWIAFVGPLTSAVLAAIGFGVYQVIPHGDMVSVAEKVVATLVLGFWASNLLVALFNLLPGLPLDGGRVLRAIVWAISGKAMTGTVAAAWVGRGLAVAVFVGMNFAYMRDGAVDPFGLGLAVFMSMFIWFGATQALVVAKLRQRIPSLSARAMTRRAITVDARLPLAEALRRAHEVDARGLVLVDAAGRPTGLVNEAQVIATPEQRRPWIEVGTVGHSLEPGMVVTADLTGEPLLDTLRAHPAPEYLVVEPGEGGAILGVLAASDVQAAFLGRPAAPPVPSRMPPQR